MSVEIHANIGVGNSVFSYFIIYMIIMIMVLHAFQQPWIRLTLYNPM